MQHLIEGQRLPNFLRPNRDRVGVNFYQACCARDVVLVTLSSGDALETVFELADPQRMLVLLVQSQPEDLPPESTCPAGTLVLADDGQVSAFLAPDTGPSVLVLDRQFRLLERKPLGQLAPPRVQHLVSQARVGTQAPILVVPRVFDNALIDRLIAAYQADSEASGVLRTEGGRVIYEQAPDVKIRREHRLTETSPLWREVEARLRLCVLPEIAWGYNFQVTRFEGVKVVAYDAAAGGYFSPHRDNDGEDTAHRRFAMTLNLNPDDYQGGELCFPEYGQCFKPARGSATIFSCNLAHEARPVTKGVRYALVSFFFSEAEQMTIVPHERRV